MPGDLNRLKFSLVLPKIYIECPHIIQNYTRTTILLHDIAHLVFSQHSVSLQYPTIPLHTNQKKHRRKEGFHFFPKLKFVDLKFPRFDRKDSRVVARR